MKPEGAAFMNKLGSEDLVREFVRVVQIERGAAVASTSNELVHLKKREIELCDLVDDAVDYAAHSPRCRDHNDPKRCDCGYVQFIVKAAAALEAGRTEK